MQDVLDLQERIEGIFTPVGAPLPMNLSHAEGLSYMLFWNNYGRHDPNLEILEVKGASGKRINYFAIVSFSLRPEDM